MQKAKLLFLCPFLLLLTSAHRPVATTENVDWINLDQAGASLQKEKRPVLIDLYTSWCGWCKEMDKKTYSNTKVIQYLQQKFYTVKLDAETRQTVHWNGKSYNFNSNYRSNDFAVYVTRGKLAFPTTVIFPADGSEPQAIPGYLEPKDFELIVKYFAEGGYGKIPFDTYQKDFKPSW